MLCNSNTTEPVSNGRQVTDRLAGALADAVNEGGEGHVYVYWDAGLAKWEYLSPREADDRRAAGVEVIQVYDDAAV